TEIQIMIYHFTRKMIEKDKWQHHLDWTRVEKRRLRKQNPSTAEEESKKLKSPWKGNKPISKLRFVNKLWSDLGAHEIYQELGTYSSRKLSVERCTQVYV